MRITALTVFHATLTELKMIKLKPSYQILLILLLSAISFLTAKAQQKISLTEGKVSYITSQNVYVTFTSTEGMEIGDTLFIQKNETFQSALIIKQLSSISCLCTPIDNTDMNVGDKIIAGIGYSDQNKQAPVPEITTQELPEKDISQQVLTSGYEETESMERNKQSFEGRLSVSSYSTFSGSVSENNQRLRYTFSMEASNVDGSNLSAETYLSFKQRVHNLAPKGRDSNNELKVYSLALKYEFNESATVWAGRKINPRIANIGAIDGIQFQKKFNKYFAGAAVGTRPDYQNYGHNINLLEYGAYFGHSHKISNGFLQSSAAIFEQRNDFKIDRRFIYLQHTNTIIKNLNLFSSLEVDLYKIENDTPENSLRLTGLFLSSGYTFSNRLSLYAAYDNRKNVIYYETFRNYADEIFEQASRQGIKFRVNYRPVSFINLGVSAGSRSGKDDPKPTRTLSGNASFLNIASPGTNLTLLANYLQNSYLDGSVFGGRISRDFLNGKINGMAQYRYVDFSYTVSSNNLQQHIIEADISYHVNRKWFVSVNIESNFQEGKNYNSLYLNLRKRL